MILLDSPEFWGETLFCDDIRQEADGKMTFVGVYGPQITVHSVFPVTLPKFAFSVSFTQKKSSFVPNLGIRIFMPQDSDSAPSIQADMRELAEGALAAELERKRVGTEPDTAHAVISLRANLIIAPFTISAPGVIKVRVLRNDALVRLGAMHVVQPPTFATN